MSADAENDINQDGISFKIEDCEVFQCDVAAMGRKALGLMTKD